MRKGTFAAALLVAVVVASVADAASLNLVGGGRLSVEPGAPVLGSVGLTSSGAVASSSPRPLVYWLTEASGRSWSGLVPTSDGVVSSDVTLAQNPMTGEILVVFAQPVPRGHDLVAMAWRGQVWSAPQVLTLEGADDRQPLLAHRPGGDALLAWVTGSGQVLLRHFDLAPGFASPTYSFVDVGRLSAIAGDAASRVGGEPRVRAVVGDADSLAGYILIGTETGAPLRVVRVALDSVVDPGGFGAAPVPVTFTRPTTQGAEPGSSISQRQGGGVDGRVFEPWRVVLGKGEAWYWVEDDGVKLLPFRGSEVGALRSLALPSSESYLHVEAVAAAREELGVGVRPLRADAPASGRRLR